MQKQLCFGEDPRKSQLEDFVLFFEQSPFNTKRGRRVTNTLPEMSKQCLFEVD